MADNSQDQEEMVTQFSDVTGVAADRAKFYLEAANWTLQLALANFYEQDDNNPMDGGGAVNMQLDDEDDDGDMDAVAAAAAAAASFGQAAAGRFAAATSKPTKKEKKPPAEKPRIATIHNMTKSSSEDEEEQGQAFYTGGSERSGQQILGPPRKNPIKDYVSEIFRSAQESGAEMMESPHPSASSSAGPSAFVGTGYRLGQTNDDHVTLPEQLSRPSRPTNIEPVTLKLWRQGFSINDGELRSYEEQSNKDFLDSIMKGEIPVELRQQGGSMVHIDLEDHRNEEYKRAAASKVKPFAGKGHTLGSPAPNVTNNPVTVASAVAMAATAASTNTTESEQTANEQLNVNVDQPTTMIQVRLADGSRLSARFNHSHTVDHVRNYIVTARPQYATVNFALLTTYPSKELTDGAQTIEKAGLLNAALLQRLK